MLGITKLRRGALPLRRNVENAEKLIRVNAPRIIRFESAYCLEMRTKHWDTDN